MRERFGLSDQSRKNNILKIKAESTAERGIKQGFFTDIQDELKQDF